MILRTALLALKYIFRDELRERLPEILGLLRELGQGSSALDNVMTLLRNLAQEANAERLNGTELRQAVVTTLSGGGELMMTIAEQWVQEGLQESLNSVRQLLLRLVRRRESGARRCRSGSRSRRCWKNWGKRCWIAPMARRGWQRWRGGFNLKTLILCAAPP